jgi:hypothetical protein
MNQKKERPDRSPGANMKGLTAAYGAMVISMVWLPRGARVLST